MPSLTLLPNSVLDLIFLYPFGTLHPTPPTNLAAIYTTSGADRNRNLIKLTWTAPVSMPDVASYNVYRNGVLLANVANTAPLVYLDEGTGGDVEFFTYFLTSVDVSGNESDPSVSICNFSQRANQFITELRRSLKDNPPDPRVQRWSDDDLWLALRMGMSRVNSIPMNTNFNFDTMPEDLFNYVIVASRIAALRMQSSLEAAKEFSMNVGGASMTLNRSAIYNSLISAEDSSFATEIKSIKLNFTMRTVHGEGFAQSSMSFKIRTYAPRQYRIR